MRVIMSLITLFVYCILIYEAVRYVMYQRPIEFLVPLPPLLSVDGWL